MIYWIHAAEREALAASERAVSYARELQHPFTLAYALTFAAWLQRLRGDVDHCVQLTTELQTLEKFHNIPLYQAMGGLLQGSARIEQGFVDEGLAELRNGLERYAKTGTAVLLPYFHTLLADGLRVAGCTADALEELERGSALLSRSSEAWCKAVLYRTRAAVLSAQGASTKSIDDNYALAMKIAAQQGSLQLGIAAGESWQRDLLKRRVSTSGASQRLTELRAQF
jgi:predicted ATPase